MKKPTITEIERCITTLSDAEILVCSLCFKEDDKNESGETVLWIQCTNCSMWAHSVCAAAIDNCLNNSSDNYVCNLCSSQFTQS